MLLVVDIFNIQSLGFVFVAYIYYLPCFGYGGWLGWPVRCVLCQNIPKHPTRITRPNSRPNVMSNVKSHHGPNTLTRGKTNTDQVRQ